MTPTKATVSRPWNVLGRSPRIAGGSRKRRREAAAGRDAAVDAPLGSALGEGVPDTSHRQDERRIGRVVLDLLAQMAHVDVDGLLVLVERLVVAQQLEQLAPGVDAPGPAGEVAQDLELGRREADPSLAALDAPPLEVDHEVLVADHPAATRVGKLPVRPAQECLDPAHQLAQAERLRQVVVRAELEPDDLVDLVVAGGQDEDRHLRAGRTHAAEDLEAVDAGQSDVEDDEVRGAARRELEALLARPGELDVVTLLLERVLDAPGDGVLVLDDQDGGGHRSMLHRGPSAAGATPPRPGRPLVVSCPPAPGASPLRHRRRAAARPSTRSRTPRSTTMPTARPTLAAEHREVTGKAVNRLRSAGKLPAVVYGHGVASSNVTVDAHAFEQLRKHSGPNALVDLSVDGKKSNPVLINSVQVHPVNRRPLHIDLFLVRMTEELTVDVPLVATGESPAVTQLGGTLLHPSETVKIRALPNHLPQSIE